MNKQYQVKDVRKVFSNPNGRDYLLIAQDRDYGIVQDVNSFQIVVVWKLNLENGDWGNGYYFEHKEMPEAVSFFKKKVRGAI